VILLSDNGANLIFVLMTRDKRSTDDFVTRRPLEH